MTPADLKAAAETLKLTPTKMARAMGFSYATYKNWQSGRYRVPAVAARCVEYMLADPLVACAFGRK